MELEQRLHRRRSVCSVDGTCVIFLRFEEILEIFDSGARLSCRISFRELEILVDVLYEFQLRACELRCRSSACIRHENPCSSERGEIEIDAFDDIFIGSHHHEHDISSEFPIERFVFVRNDLAGV